MIDTIIADTLQQIIKELYDTAIKIDSSVIQKTRKEFQGDYTIAVFPYAKTAHKAPDMVAQEIGNALTEKLQNFTTKDGISGSIASFNVVKGFLNLSLEDNFWKHFLDKKFDDEQFGIVNPNETAPILIEYSSPNTNKPLHLGHVRNNLLGYSVALILQACGKKTLKVNLVNDRGIHICKSMIAWQKFGHGETPQNTRMKGDHLVGKYYVEFDKEYKKQIQTLIQNGTDKEKAEQEAPLLTEAHDMLRKWEAGDKATHDLWNKMNGWVYEGFDETYRRLGISFDKTYYESNTYLTGKSLVEEGIAKGVFIKKDDGSVWVDLKDNGLDEKLLLRKDGTSVYMTQDLGTALMRYEEFHPSQMIYVVGNEQNYHFDVLKIILSDKLHQPFGQTIQHLSYGMVELPNGKMKSREGTVVDADDLMDEMILQAKSNSEALGKIDFTAAESLQLYKMIGLGALKYYILKVDPKKNMLFDPAESIDLNGNTAPFIQYTHARIKSLIRKASSLNFATSCSDPVSLAANEKELLKSLYEFPQVIQAAGDTLNPSLIANYIYNLSKDFNRFYQETPIFKENNVELQYLRLKLALFIAHVIKKGMSLLGIDVPEKM